jgi:integrase
VQAVGSQVEYLLHRASGPAYSRSRMPHVNLHDLRRLCASILVGLGVDLYTISKVLGHSSVQSTQRYADIQAEAPRAALQKIGELVDRSLVSS